MGTNLILFFVKKKSYIRKINYDSNGVITVSYYALDLLENLAMHPVVRVSNEEIK